MAKNDSSWRHLTTGSSELDFLSELGAGIRREVSSIQISTRYKLLFEAILSYLVVLRGRC